MGTSGNSETGHPRVRLVHIWLLLPALLVTWMGFMHPLRRLDFWWQLKAGQVIVESGQIPREDLFSFTQAGEPFILYGWLSAVLYHIVHLAGGFQLLIAFNTALLVLTLLFVYRTGLEANPNRRPVALCLLLAALVLGLYSNIRAQVFSFVFFAAYVWVLLGYIERRRDCLWLLPALMVPWVNLHGAFVLGLVLIGLVLASESVRRVAGWSHGTPPGSPALGKLTLILGVTALATLANPETWHVYEYVRQLQADPASQTFVTEWQPPSIRDSSDVLTFFGPFFIVLLGFVYGRRPNLTALVLFLAFAAFGLASVRNGIWFALVGTPLLVRQIATDAPPRKRTTELPMLNTLLVGCLLLFTLLLSPWVRPRLGLQALRPDLIEAGTPVRAMDYLRREKVTGHTFHPQDYGDYLIWRLWPQQRAFFDGRVHLYDADFVRTYFEILTDEAWEEALAAYEIDYLLLPKDDQLTAGLTERAERSPNWMRRYEDDVSILFARQW